MMIPGPPPGTNAEDDAAGLEPPSSDAPESPPTAPRVAAVAALAYADFAAALKDALRDFHSADLLARNPLLRDGICNLGGSAGPRELKAMLAETVSALFGNPRDEKLRRVIELTYFQPAPKQEVVADRLSLSFGTYRRHLTTGRAGCGRACAARRSNPSCGLGVGQRQRERSQEARRDPRPKPASRRRRGSQS